MLAVLASANADLGKPGEGLELLEGMRWPRQR